MMWDRAVDATANWLCRTFPSRYREVPHATSGKPMLRQFKLPGRAYLQSFVDAEEYEYMHNHRWDKVRSFILSGWYDEERPGRQVIRRKRFTTYTMTRDVIHRIEFWAPRTWTLFIQSEGQDLSQWRYYVAHPLRWAGQVKWEDHIQNRVANLEHGNLT